MVAEPEQSLQPRVPLTRDRVLRAAIQIADAEGLEALTMRRLGQELGVQAMSLYNHVANKDDLYQGIVDLVMDEIEVPSDASDWKAALRSSAISYYEALLRHRWACTLKMSTPTINDSRMLWMEGVLRTLREAGFSPNMFPMAVHNLFDIAAGALLVASPWIFGFADDGTNVWAPFVVVGIAAIGLGLTTKQSGGYSYRRTTPVAG